MGNFSPTKKLKKEGNQLMVLQKWIQFNGSHINQENWLLVRLQWFRCAEEKAILENEYIFHFVAMHFLALKLYYSIHAQVVWSALTVNKSHMDYYAWCLLFLLEKFVWGFNISRSTTCISGLYNVYCDGIAFNIIAFKYNFICGICVIFSMN